MDHLPPGECGPPSPHANATNDAHTPLALKPALEVPGSVILGGLELPTASAAGAGVATAVPQPAGGTGAATT